MKFEQGDVLKVEGLAYPIVVVSNDFFNSSGCAVVCPIIRNTKEGPLHIRINAAQAEGYVVCEQLRYLDLSVRRFSKVSSLTHYDVLDISDAVMGIFDYQQL